jgi:hypothetical protein
MIVDQEQKFSLCSYSKRNGTLNIKKSDHNLLYLEIRKSWKTFIKQPREEIYNFNDNEGFNNFVEKTETSEALRHCFDDEEEDIDVSSKRWLKIINDIIRVSFRKIRIGKHKVNPELEKLFQQKETAMDSLSKLELDDDVDGIAEVKDQLNVEYVVKRIRKLLKHILTTMMILLKVLVNQKRGN